MRVTLLGTGCPVAHLHRYGPAQLVEAAGTRVLVGLRLRRGPSVCWARARAAPSWTRL